MKILYTFCLLSSWFLTQNLSAQSHQEHDHSNLYIHVLGAYISDTSLLQGANVFWLNTTNGAATNEKGIATLPLIDDLPNGIVVTYIGLENDTILIENGNKKHYYVFLPEQALLKDVEVTRKKQTSFISTLNPIREDFLGKDELKKAACCDLSESFETNAAVDVSYSDGATGAKEIQLLGLDGVYVEMLEQNIPSLRGLAVPFGLTFVPGPWLQSISISKGAGTITTGHQSITGTISYQYKRPFETNRFELDLFANHLGRYELNALTSHEFSEKLATVFAVNAGGLPVKQDKNNDNFLDQPLYNRFNIMNNWMYRKERIRGQIAINYLVDDRTGGQEQFNMDDKGTTNAYGLGLRTNRVDAYGKNGILFPERPNTSIGLLYSFNYYDQNGFFGLKEYTGKQYSANTTFLFKSIIRNTNHGITAGGNFYADFFNEKFENIVLDNEFWNAGVFVEYSYKFEDKLNIVSGVRLDYHNQQKLQFNPRLHIKYNPRPNTTLRASVGRGFRIARVLGENISLMASSRSFIIEEQPGNEAAWNTGISFVQKFDIKQRQGYVALDFFHTNFQRQVIVDVNAMDNTVRIYNLDGKSYANSFLAEVGYDVFPGLSLKLAYKMDDVKTTFRDGLETQPFTYLHKGLFVVNYKSKNDKWQFDVNLDMHGKHRLPSSFAGDSEEKFSPVFVQLGAQVSRFFSNGIEIYVGGENITNYRQPNPIIGSENPFGDRFDTSQVWGPIVGGIFYGGFRYTLEKKERN